MAPAFNIHDVFNQVDAWDAHTPDYSVISNGLGAASPSDSTVVMNGIANLTEHTPSLVAFVLANDVDRIYLGHSAAVYSANLFAPTTMDGMLVLISGSRSESCVALCLDGTATDKIVDTPVPSVATITGATAHAAPNPVMRVAAPNNQAPTVTVRRIIVLPSYVSGALLQAFPEGYLDQRRFYMAIQAALLNASLALIATWDPVLQWWTAACTDPCVLSVNLISPANPAQSVALEKWKSSTLAHLHGRVPHLGPGLTAAHLDSSMMKLQQTMVDNAQARMTFDRDRAVKTMADRHGEELTRTIMRLCDVTDEVNLPPVHTLLAKSPKGSAYGIVGAELQARALDSDLKVDEAAVPLVTPTLLDQVFCRYQPASPSGMEFGVGLTPFAIVCGGHKEMAAVRATIQKATFVEGVLPSLWLTPQPLSVPTSVCLPTRRWPSISSTVGPWWLMCSMGRTTQWRSLSGTVPASLAPRCPAFVRRIPTPRRCA